MATAKLPHTQEHLDYRLDSKLSITEHINNKISKTTKATGLLCKLRSILPLWNFLTVNESFIRERSS